MIKFLKSLMGYPTEAEKAAAKQSAAEAPYKVEAPAVKVEDTNSVAVPAAKTTRAKAPAKPKAPAKAKAPAKPKAPAKIKAPAKATAKPKAPAKAPAKPRAPKKTK